MNELKYLSMCALIVCGVAHAQSSVTLYGVADTSLRYLTGANSADKSQVSLTDGAISQSRWGLLGTEDLGAGMKAFFRLESGFRIPNGSLQSSGVIFNRYAYVGLASDTYGRISLGQQNNPVFELLTAAWDPLTVGNYMQNEWAPVAFGGALHGRSNTAIYTYSSGGLKAQLGYGFGNVAGSLATGSMRSATISYEPNPIGAEVGMVQTLDANGRRQTSENVSLRYGDGPVGLWLGYYHSNDESGAVDSFLTGTTTAAQTVNPRKDNVFVAGASYLFTPAFSLTGAFYYDQATQILGLAGSGGDGKRLSPVLLAQYFLSKQVTFYSTVDYNRMIGAASSEAPNKKDQFGAGVGLRYRF